MNTDSPEDIDPKEQSLPPALVLRALDEHSCKEILDILSHDPLEARRIKDEDAKILIEDIGKGLLRNIGGSPSEGNTSLIELYLRILSKLCRGEALLKSTTNFSNVVVCAEKDMCGVVTKVFADYVQHPEIAELCALLIMILASDNTPNQLSLTTAGACSHLVNAIKHHLDNSATIDILLRACRNIASNVSNASPLIAAGMSEQIVVNKYLEDPEVIEATLWLIVNISCDEDAATALGVLGVCSLVADILGRWIENADITQGGCWAIRNLACAEAANYAVISNTNVIPLLIEALDKHKENAKVSECTLWALANIGYDKDLSVRIIEAGLIPVLMDVANIILTREREHSPAMFAMIAMDDAFLWAVRNISAASEGNNVYFNENVIQQCVVILLREHGREPKFAEVSMGAIGNLIHDNDAASTAMASHFMVEAVAQVTCGYFSDELVLATGLKALYFMCKVHNARMKEIGLDKVGAASIKAYPNNSDIVRYGCEILLNVYYVSHESRTALRAANAIDENGRVVQIDSVEARNEVWIPETEVKANEWFTVSGDDDANCETKLVDTDVVGPEEDDGRVAEGLP